MSAPCPEKSCTQNRRWNLRTPTSELIGRHGRASRVALKGHRLRRLTPLTRNRTDRSPKGVGSGGTSGLSLQRNGTQATMMKSSAWSSVGRTETNVMSPWPAISIRVLFPTATKLLCKSSKVPTFKALKSILSPEPAPASKPMMVSLPKMSSKRITSSPWPPSSVSSPVPPSSVSFPWPLSSVSSPAPPWMESLPLEVVMASLPPRACMS